mmetsp:Transcript_11788/g.21787  ORF Transcript_11788/g.21787 Transcript_11788/m.21787 type:complete len:848 (+) Transcript_11788:122-2665(+)
MGRLDGPAFLPCRQYGLVGRPGSAAAVPHIPPSLFSVVLHSHGNDDIFDNSTNMKIFPTRIGSQSFSYDRAYSSTKKKTIGSSTKQNMDRSLSGCYEKSTAKKSATSGFMSLLFAVTVLLGNPNFDGIGDVTMNCKASALESTSNNDQLQSSSWPPSSSTLSDHLFKSMAAREITRDPSSQPLNKKRYWDSMNGSTDEIKLANEKLIDHAVATVSTMYYDSSGGFNFDPQEFYAKWKKFRYTALHPHEGVSSSWEKNNVDEFDSLAENGFATRGNAVKSLKSILSSLNDPYSKYLTREELRMELQGGHDGFLGLGALVKASSPSYSIPLNEQFAVPMSGGHRGSHSKSNSKKGILSVAQAANLPVVTAIIPDSPAERAGLVVGDRIASVGDYQFTGMSRSQVEKTLKQKFHGENYFGRAELTVAKKVMTSSTLGLDNDNARYDTDGNIIEEKYVFEDGWYRPTNNRQRISDDMLSSEQVLGYKLSHVKSISTMLTAKLDSSVSPTNAASPEMSQQSKFPSVVGGDYKVHFELLTPDDSIFQHMTNSGERRPVGYIRLTRFSRASTTGFISAINSLEEAGAQSYIIDLRNNYGGVIQEAMLTASTLLRDPHSVLCYTLNSRGGFRPQENMEYIVDAKYPGYLLSSESSTVSRDQVRREHPEYLEDGGWSSPTSYASLNELRMTRGFKPAHTSGIASSSNGGVRGEGLERPTAFLDGKEMDLEKLADVMTWNSQKKIVILVNEGTASSAEVFASALHDNGRTVALVGTKTFGKGLIQHTFPMPDGGGLRLTVAEYLTPSLQHVTKVGGAKNDSGIKPDIYCQSKQGIPQNVGADLCVGVALDVLESEGG